jgi:protein-disulfide isomerase
VADSPQRGPGDAWVTVVEFADFECRFCRDEQPILTDIASIYGADLRLVFKYFPLPSIHPHAQAAAVAAECAGEQGRFWEMHDLLFTTALDETTLLIDAERVSGLDVADWQACVAAPEAASRVAADLALGTSFGVDGTPTFVVNGVPVVGALSETDLRAIIDRARAEAVASGIPRADYYDEAVLGI